MDFALALFPWAITMKLRMRKYEKVGLALTMSLGMLYVHPNQGEIYYLSAIMLIRGPI